MLEGRLRADELAAAMAQNTRALLRKQLTWFRTQLPPHPVLAAGQPHAGGAVSGVRRQQARENDHVGREEERGEERRQHAERQALKLLELPRLGQPDPGRRGGARSRPMRPTVFQMMKTWRRSPARSGRRAAPTASTATRISLQAPGTARAYGSIAAAIKDAEGRSRTAARRAAARVSAG